MLPRARNEYEIMGKIKQLGNNLELSKYVKLSLTNVEDCIDSVEISKLVKGPLTYSQVSETKGLDEKDTGDCERV